MSARPRDGKHKCRGWVVTVVWCALLCVAAWCAPRSAWARDYRADPGGDLAPAVDGLRLELGADVGNFRWWTQREPSTGEQRRYSATVYGGPRVVGEYEHALHRLFTMSFEASYFRSLVLSSWSARAGAPVETTAERIDGQVGFHVRPGRRRHLPWIGLVGGVGYWSYDFNLPEDLELERPRGNYTFARGRMQVRMRVGPTTISVAGGYVHTWQADDLDARTIRGGQAPRGYESLFSIRYYPIEWLGVSVLASYTELRFQLKPLPGRDDKPARVVDRYLQLGAGAVLRF